MLLKETKFVYLRQKDFIISKQLHVFCPNVKYRKIEFANFVCLLYFYEANCCLLFSWSFEDIQFMKLVCNDRSVRIFALMQH